MIRSVVLAKSKVGIAKWSKAVTHPRLLRCALLVGHARANAYACASAHAGASTSAHASSHVSRNTTNRWA